MNDIEWHCSKDVYRLYLAGYHQRYVATVSIDVERDQWAAYIYSSESETYWDTLNEAKDAAEKMIIKEYGL